MKRAPHVRKVNMLSEYTNPDNGGEHGTRAFFRALSEADKFVHDIDHAAELACRCDELTQLITDIKDLHPRHVERTSAEVCSSCLLAWPCPTMKLIGAAI
jgi:hypothetical protein